LTDVRFERFVRVPEGRTRALRVRRDGARRLRLVADLVHPSGRVLRRDLAFDEATWSAAEVEHPKLQPMAERGVAAQDPYCASGPIRLGGEFDCLRDIRIGATGRTARFAPPDGAWAGARIPALMLDAAMRLSAMHAAGVSDTLYAPVGIGRVWCAAQAPAAAPMTLRATAPVLDGDEVRSARVEAVDAQGRLALVVEAGVARRIGHMHASS
jgi:hypothetical protein